MDIDQLVHLFVLSFVFPFVMLPALGGGAVAVGYRLINIPDVTFWRCWKVYLAAFCYAFLALIPLRFLLQPGEISESTHLLINAGVLLGVQLLLVPLLMRKFSGRALGVTIAAVLLTNLVAFLFLNHIRQM